MLTREVEQRISRSLQHKNVVKFWGFEQDLDGKCRLLMERVSGGSLTAMLYKYGPLLEQMNSLVAYTRQLAEAINYLHTQSVIHRDIKGDNVLVDTYTGVIKLADFNVSKRQSLMQTAFGTVIGTPNFMAPEAARGNWCPASDVWSLGCTVHQMITGLPPHHTKSSDTLQEMYMSQGVTAPTIASSLQAELRQLLQSCFQEEPTKRPSAAALLETPILRNAYSDLPQGDPSASVGSNGTQAAEGGGGGGGAPPDSPLSSSSSSMLAPPSALPSRSGRVSPGPMARRLSLAFSTPNGKQHRMSVADATEWDTAAIKQEISLHLIDCLKEEKADVVAKWTYVASRHLTAWAEKWRDHLPLLLGELVTVLEDTNATVSADAGGASDTHVDRRTAQRLATLVSDWQHLVDGEGLEQAASAACDLLVLFTREGEPPDGHALAEILRRRQTPPHWIFAIEQQLKDAGDALRQRLQRAAVDASATTRPPSAAAAVSTDMKRNAQFE